ncbi:MAG: deoxyhypusine synthase family protein [Fuerstiella sp.]|nr:deoxyhypusine synthase family protein [Fuerstiella sp.]MCP4511511.1 deoxyhypusine synthase family protein [Fuerstiella sp.]
MSHRELHDGRSDGLRPLVSLDLDRVRSFSDLLDAMADTAFSGRSAGEAARILTDMFRDQACGVVMTVSGAMTVAKQGKIICDLIDRGCIQAIVGTGALIAHGLTESIGLTHYRADPNQSDEDLFEKGYNRIYDTLEMEANLNDLSTMVEDVLMKEQPGGGVWSSHTFCRSIGKRLSERDIGTGILRSAWEKDVPVFIPAFTDSELGLDFSTWAIKATLNGMSSQQRAGTSLADALKNVPRFNPFLDLFEYAQRVERHDSLGVFTIGGGVPRNWAQQVGPFIDITNDRCETLYQPPRFRYGVRICPEPVHWGGLSGCTYSEGVSWGKFFSPADGGQFAEVYSDATVILPLLIKAVLERLDCDD